LNPEAVVAPDGDGDLYVREGWSDGEVDSVITQLGPENRRITSEGSCCLFLNGHLYLRLFTSNMVKKRQIFNTCTSDGWQKKRLSRKYRWMDICNMERENNTMLAYWGKWVPRLIDRILFSYMNVQ